MSNYATANGISDVNSSVDSDSVELLKDQDRTQIEPYNTQDSVSEALSDMTVIEDVYSNKVRGRYLVRFKKEYVMDIPNVVSSVYSDEVQTQAFDISKTSYTELRKQQENLDIENKLDLFNVKSLESVNALYMELKPEEVNQLLSNPMVASIEEDKPIQIAEDRSLAQVENQPVKESAQTIPWGIHSTGSYILKQAVGSGGNPIKIAVFDTGISSHSDLHIAGGVSYVDSVQEYSDDKGHGTHIAGTIAALDNAVGVVGAAPDSELYAVKVANSSGEGYTSSVIEGIEWAIENKIKIINMSFVSAQYSESLHEAIKKANDAGIIIVAAAGNNGAGEDTIQYPAKYPEVIAVGAVDSSHHRADYSATGAELDLVAPGYGIISTTMNGGYGVSSGTSNAAAHVTGAAALLWSHHPSWNGQQITEKLYETATPLDVPNETGKGIINVAKAEGIITGAIAPLSEENLSGLNTVLPSNPEGELEIASYDLVNNGASINPGESVTVSLKLEGDQNGANPHSSVIVEVTSASNPAQIIGTKTFTGVRLDQAISYTWQTSSTTPTGTYHIKYRYPAFPSGSYDDTFVIYVAQPGVGDDTFEPNDTFLTAKNVFPNNSYISYISSSSDVDYYKLTANENGQIPIGITIPSSVDYELDIYNESGVQVGVSSNGTGVAENIDLQVGQNKVYYIKVTGFSGQFSSSPYTLTLGSIETTPFVAPTGLEAVPYSNSIKLSWDTMLGATSYKLKLDGVEAGTATTNSYTFTNLQSSKGYILEVAAVYPEGTSSYASIQAATTLPELIVYQPQDVNQASRSSQLFSFKPATTGVYRIFTSSYQSNGQAVDTELGIYTNLQLSKQIATNDDVNDTVFSEIDISLIGGQTYYVKVSGFDSTVLRTRITAEVISSSIPYIQLDHPVDINERAGNSNVYVFVPANNGKFRIGTNRYGGNASSRANDTELSVFADVDMETTITNGYNDDKADSTFSEVIVNLSAGVPYYIRANEVNGSKTYARLLVTSAGQTAFTPLSLGAPIDLSKASGEEAYLQFTPGVTGKYRFFTSNYQASSQSDDTEVSLYTDSDLSNLLDSSDDIGDYRPYGEHFSKLEVNLNAGTTYYVAVRSFGSVKGLQTRFTVENIEQNSADTARSLPFGELITADSHGAPLAITSLYDVDYYKFELTAPEQISLNLSQGNGVIEDAIGNVKGYFSLEGQQSFELGAGTYYLRIENDLIHKYSQAPGWKFTKFEYELSIDINIIEYTHGDTSDVMSTLRSIGTNYSSAFDATPGSGDKAKVQYKNKKDTSWLWVEVKTSTFGGGYLVTQYKVGGDFNKGNLTEVTWNGHVQPTYLNSQLFTNSGTVSGQNKYWAKNGIYDVIVYRLDGTKKKDPQMFTVQVFNDPFHRLNLVPAAPVKQNGRNITKNDIYNCDVCTDYYNRYVYNPSYPIHDTDYEYWFEGLYGPTKIKQFWSNADKLITCSEGTALDQLQCTIDAIGLIPVLGEPADAVNGVIYLIRGEYVNALLSAGAIIPVEGAFFTGVKKVSQVYKSDPCGCLPEGTTIVTKEGSKPIEQIELGDLVLAKDTDTGKQGYKPVTKLYDRENDELYAIGISGETVRTTANHPFWVKGKGWVAADELAVGDQLETETSALLNVESISLLDQASQVYNFEVADYHSYYISELGLLTHNLTEACVLKNYDGVVPYRLTGNNQEPSTILNAELKKATGIIKPTGWAAHHIVPVKEDSISAVRARNLIKLLGIDINSSANGVFLPPKEPGDAAIKEIDGEYLLATHNTKHGETYYDFVWDQLKPIAEMEDRMKAKAAALSVLSEIRVLLLTGKLKIWVEGK